MTAAYNRERINGDGSDGGESSDRATGFVTEAVAGLGSSDVLAEARSARARVRMARMSNLPLPITGSRSSCSQTNDGLLCLARWVVTAD